MKAGQPHAWLAAIYGPEQDDVEKALKGIRDLGLRARLTSLERDTGKTPRDPLRLLPALLAGEHLILAPVTVPRTETATDLLRGIGAPAIFVLPSAIPPRSCPPDEQFSASVTALPFVSAIRALAERHGPPCPCAPGSALFSRLSVEEHRLQQIRKDILEARRLDHTLSPAADWLIDNGYLFEVHTAEVRKNLPKRYTRILPATRANPHTPRIYEVASALTRHTDFVLTPHSIAEVLAIYQSVQSFTMAELWVFPQMLRFALIEGIACAGGAVHRSHQMRQIAHFWANRLGRAARLDEQSLVRITAHLEAQPYILDPNFVTSLAEQLRDEPAGLMALQHVTEKRCSTPLAELVRKEHQEETANRVSIANAVTSLRQLDRLEYRSIFEAASATEQILRRDTSGIHSRSNFSTRDRCRHAVEQISRTGPLDEEDVARCAVQLAEAGSSPVERVASYYLLDAGRERLERQCASRPLLSTRFLRFPRRHPAAVYLCASSLLTMSFLSVMMFSAWEYSMLRPVSLGLLALLGIFPLSDLAIQVVNSLIFRFFPPDELPRLSLEHGIPAESATLVVVPTMFSSRRPRDGRPRGWKSGTSATATRMSTLRYSPIFRMPSPQPGLRTPPCLRVLAN